MTTADCCNWAESALALAKRNHVTLQSALTLTRPSVATESDLEFAMTKLIALSTRNAQQKVEDTSDPAAVLVAQLNRDAFVAVLNETGLVVPAAEFAKWRPTKRTRGSVDGMPVSVECIATDGNLAIFLPVVTEGHSLGSAYVGHAHRFCWTTQDSPESEPVDHYGPPPTLFSNSKPRGEVTKKPRKPKKPTLKQIVAQLLHEI